MAKRKRLQKQQKREFRWQLSERQWAYLGWLDKKYGARQNRKRCGSVFNYGKNQRDGDLRFIQNRNRKARKSAAMSPRKPW